MPMKLPLITASLMSLAAMSAHAENPSWMKALDCYSDPSLFDIFNSSSANAQISAAADSAGLDRSFDLQDQAPIKVENLDSFLDHVVSDTKVRSGKGCIFEERSGQASSTGTIDQLVVCTTEDGENTLEINVTYGRSDTRAYPAKYKHNTHSLLDNLRDAKDTDLKCTVVD